MTEYLFLHIFCRALCRKFSFCLSNLVVFFFLLFFSRLDSAHMSEEELLRFPNCAYDPGLAATFLRIRNQIVRWSACYFSGLGGVFWLRAWTIRREREEREKGKRKRDRKKENDKEK